jgi:hypothetical protein
MMYGIPKHVGVGCEPTPTVYVSPPIFARSIPLPVMAYISQGRTTNGK